jgi:hypothetical protein
LEAGFEGGKRKREEAQGEKAQGSKLKGKNRLSAISACPVKFKNHLTGAHSAVKNEIKLIKTEDAFFVISSDVYGPMGHELIPFASKADAEGFKKDHKGNRILRFENIKPGIIKKLD